MTENLKKRTRVKKIPRNASWSDIPHDAKHLMDNFRVYNHRKRPDRVNIGGQWFLLYRNGENEVIHFTNGWLYYLDPNQE